MAVLLTVVAVVVAVLILFIVAVIVVGVWGYVFKIWLNFVLYILFKRLVNSKENIALCRERSTPYGIRGTHEWPCNHGVNKITLFRFLHSPVSN